MAQKIKVGNAWLHKAALVTHRKISLCAKLWTDWTRARDFDDYSRFPLFHYLLLCVCIYSFYCINQPVCYVIALFSVSTVSSSACYVNIPRFPLFHNLLVISQ